MFKKFLLLLTSTFALTTGYAGGPEDEQSLKKNSAQKKLAKFSFFDLLGTQEHPDAPPVGITSTRNISQDLTAATTCASPSAHQPLQGGASQATVFKTPFPLHPRVPATFVTGQKRGSIDENQIPPTKVLKSETTGKLPSTGRMDLTAATTCTYPSQVSQEDGVFSHEAIAKQVIMGSPILGRLAQLPHGASFLHPAGTIAPQITADRFLQRMPFQGLSSVAKLYASHPLVQAVASLDLMVPAPVHQPPQLHLPIETRLSQQVIIEQVTRPLELISNALGITEKSFFDKLSKGAWLNAVKEFLKEEVRKIFFTEEFTTMIDTCSLNFDTFPKDEIKKHHQVLLSHKNASQDGIRALCMKGQVCASFINYLFLQKKLGTLTYASILNLLNAWALSEKNIVIVWEKDPQSKGYKIVHRTPPVKNTKKTINILHDVDLTSGSPKDLYKSYTPPFES
jgi:hypothetical protein